MRVQLQPGDTPIIGLVDENTVLMDGEFKVSYDTESHPEAVVIEAAISANDIGHAGVIYREAFDGPDPKGKITGGRDYVRKMQQAVDLLAKAVDDREMADTHSLDSHEVVEVDSIMRRLIAGEQVELTESSPAVEHVREILLGNCTWQDWDFCGHVFWSDDNKIAVINWQN